MQSVRLALEGAFETAAPQAALAGTRAFEGEDVAETLANVINKEPAWERLPAAASPRVVQVLRACQSKGIAGVAILGDSTTAFPAPGSRLGRLREAEVEHLYRAVTADLDVGRLEIAMNDPLLVRGFERVRNLLRKGSRLVDRHRASGDPLRRAPGDQHLPPRTRAAP